jgi:alpha-beta hydrolase superfamily lysophospholipase
MTVFGVVNETSALAKKKGLPTGYLEARPDIEAAVDYAHKMNGKKPIVILGSSYSASLALLISAQSDRIKAVVAFSPGEFLKGTNVAQEIASLNKPIFVTSAKSEIEATTDIVRFVKGRYVTQFKPDVDGFHGSKTLWESVRGFETYWSALLKFLAKLQPEGGKSKSH